MIRSEKINAVAELEEIYRSNPAIIVTHYHGLTVSAVTKLRNDLRKEGATFKVIKNTLAKIAAKNAGISSADSLFKGPVAIAYSHDSVSTAKAVAEFAKTHADFKIVGGILDSGVVDSTMIDKLSKLPSMKELQGTIVGILQAPARQIIGVTNAPASQLARVFSAYSNKNK